MRGKLSVLTLALLAVCGCTPLSRVPPAPAPEYTYAEDALRRGDYQDAIVRFDAFLGRTDDPSYRPRALYQLAWAHYELHQYRQTLDMLNQLTIEFPKQSGPQVAALRGNAEYALGNHTNGFLSWEQAWQQGDNEDRKVLQGRMERALSSMTETELRQLSALTTDPDVTAMIQAYLDQPLAVARTVPPQKPKTAALEERETLSSGQLYSSPAPGQPASDLRTAEVVGTKSADAREPTMNLASNPAASPPAEREVVDEGPEHMEEPSRPEELRRSEEPGRSEEEAPALGSDHPTSRAPRVAALLPLTGSNKQAGWDALNALRLAFLDSPNSLTVRDTAGEATLARDLLGKLATDPTIVVVIGPLGSAEADAVGRDAERLRMPVVLPAQSTSVHGRFIVRVDPAQTADATETMALRFQQYTGRAPTPMESQVFLTGFAIRDTINRGATTRDALVGAGVREGSSGRVSFLQGP